MDAAAFADLLLSTGCSVDGVAAGSSNAFLTAVGGLLQHSGSAALPAASGGQRYAIAAPQWRAPATVAHAHDSTALQRAWSETAPHHHADAVLPQYGRTQFSLPPPQPLWHLGRPRGHAPLPTASEPRYSAVVAAARSNGAALVSASSISAPGLSASQSTAGGAIADSSSPPPASVVHSAPAPSSDVVGEAGHRLESSMGMPSDAELRESFTAMDSMWRRVHDRGLTALSQAEVEGVFGGDTPAAAAAAAATSTSGATARGVFSSGLFDQLAATASQQYGPDVEAEWGDDGLEYASTQFSSSGDAAATLSAAQQREGYAVAVEAAVQAAWRDASSSSEGLGGFGVEDELSDVFAARVSTVESDWDPSTAAATQGAPRVQPVAVVAGGWEYTLGDPASNPFLNSSSTNHEPDASLFNAAITNVDVSPTIAPAATSSAASALVPASALIESLYASAQSAHASGADIRGIAIPAFEAVLHLCPEHAEAWRLLGECHAELDDDRSAIGCFHRAVEADPYNRGALLSLGVSLVNEDQRGEAAATLEAWLRSDPRFHALTEAAASAAATAAADPYADGSALDTVTRLLLAAERSAPGEPELSEALGVLYNLGGDYEAAAAAFHTALRGLQRRAAPPAGGVCSPHAARLINRVGASLAHKGAHAEALATYAQVLAARPGFARAWLNAGISHLSSSGGSGTGGDAAHMHAHSAVRHYLQALRLAPGAGHIWALVRSALVRLDRFDLVGLTEARNVSAFDAEFAPLQ